MRYDEQMHKFIKKPTVNLRGVNFSYECVFGVCMYKWIDKLRQDFAPAFDRMLKETWNWSDSWLYK